MESKKNFTQILILVLSVVALIGSYFYVGGTTPDFGGASGGTNLSGTTEFSGVIRTYDPILVIPLNTSGSIVEEVRAREDVKNVRTDPQGYVIDAETRDDVFVIGAYLRSMNVSALSVANVAVTKPLEVQTITGKVNATVPGGIIRIVMEPILDSGGEVTVSMVAVVRNNALIDYNSAGLALNEINVLMDAEVIALERTSYTYSIPWEERNSLNLSGNHTFRRIDSIIFSKTLDISQITQKKQLSYVTYIDSRSAQVLPSFDEAAQVAFDFSDVGYSLPPSTLITDFDAGLDFNRSVAYRYAIRLSDPRVESSLSQLSIQSESPLDANQTIKLNVTALEMGQKIISLKRVSLPS